MALFIRKGLASILGACLLAGASISPAVAQDSAREFSPATGDVVNTVMELADDKKIQAALDELQGLLGQPNLNAYERATIYQMMGQYSYELDRLDDSQRAFENALLQSDGLLPHEIDNLNVVIAQLMIGNGQYSEGAARLENYLAAGGEEKPQYVELLVNARVQAEDYAGALPWAEKWFETASPKTRRHYDLMNFLYNNLEMPDDQIRLIKEMIDQWPEDRYLWFSWASILADAGREAEAFEVHKMMYQAGLLMDEEDLLHVVQYYAYYDMPYEAAKFLEREIEDGRIAATSDNLKQTASYFAQAREPERAIPFLARAAKLSDDIDINSDLGEALADAGDCAASEAAFDVAIKQEYETGKARMLVGMCYVDQYGAMDQLSCNMTDAQWLAAPLTLSRDAAVKAFKSVPQTSRESGNAEKWIQFISAEIQADKRRCGEGHNIQPDLCYQKIKMAYDAEIFTGGFKLDDAGCQQHIAEYDALFRRGASSE